jgi:hypothetical protein
MVFAKHECASETNTPVPSNEVRNFKEKLPIMEVSGAEAEFCF